MRWIRSFCLGMEKSGAGGGGHRAFAAAVHPRTRVLTRTSRRFCRFRRCRGPRCAPRAPLRREIWRACIPFPSPERARDRTSEEAKGPHESLYVERTTFLLFLFQLYPSVRAYAETLTGYSLDVVVAVAVAVRALVVSFWSVRSCRFCVVSSRFCLFFFDPFRFALVRAVPIPSVFVLSPFRLVLFVFFLILLVPFRFVSCRARAAG